MSAHPETVKWLILFATAWTVGLIWMAGRARHETLVRRCGGRR